MEPATKGERAGKRFTSTSWSSLFPKTNGIVPIILKVITQHLSLHTLFGLSSFYLGKSIYGHQPMKHDVFQGVWVNYNSSLTWNTIINISNVIWDFEDDSTKYQSSEGILGPFCSICWPVTHFPRAPVPGWLLAFQEAMRQTWVPQSLGCFFSKWIRTLGPPGDFDPAHSNLYISYIYIYNVKNKNI